MGLHLAREDPVKAEVVSERRDGCRIRTQSNCGQSWPVVSEGPDKLRSHVLRESAALPPLPQINNVFPASGAFEIRSAALRTPVLLFWKNFRVA
jgi:hypothetical protein